MSAEVAPGVHRLGTRWVNWYVVEDGARLTVVDAGLPQYWDQLTAALAAMGRRISDVEAVVLTHNHFDHLGCAERVRAESGGRAYIHPADAAVARGDERPKPPPGALGVARRLGFIIWIAHLASQGGLGLTPITELTTFTDDEQLDVPGRLRVIATPGTARGTARCCSGSAACCSPVTRSPRSTRPRARADRGCCPSTPTENRRSPPSRGSSAPALRRCCRGMAPRGGAT
jgi:glyoxylase-like metal-dependent hydrolase (beta-lactamase superfamily II)